MTEARQASSSPLRIITSSKDGTPGTERAILMRARPDAHLDMMRRETLQSLLDPRARWPDGTPREIPVPLWERMKLKEAERAQP